MVEKKFDAGVLDLKWIFFENKLLLICACNDGLIRIYDVKKENGEYLINLIKEITFESGTKCLYTDVKIYEYFKNLTLIQKCWF